MYEDLGHPGLDTENSEDCIVSYHPESDCAGKERSRKRQIIEIWSDSEDEDDGEDDEETSSLIMFGCGFDKAQEHDHSPIRGTTISRNSSTFINHRIFIG